MLLIGLLYSSVVHNLIRQGKETAVFWNDGRGEPVVDYDGAREKKAGEGDKKERRARAR